MYLNKTLKDKITAALMAHRFEKEVAARAEEQETLVLRVYLELFPEKERERMRGLPTMYLEQRPEIRVQLTGRGVVALPFGRRFTWPFTTLRLLLGSAAPDTRNFPGRFREISVVGPALERELEDMLRGHEVLSEAITEARNAARRALDSFKSVKRLREEWPEVAPFLPVDPAEASRLLPVIARADLNQMLGLEVKADE